MTDTYDGIILGAGHNALVLQAYLGKAGLKTVAVERRDTAGGGLVTTSDPEYPGFLHNTHSFFHRAITDMPWFRDLELERRGVRYLEPELNAVLIPDEGPPLEWWTDIERTIESVAAFSRIDAATVRRWAEAFVPVLENVVVHEQTSPPLEPDRRKELLSRSPEGRLFLETSELSPQEFVLREFEHPVVQGGLLFFNGLREVDLRSKGFGHHIPALLASDKKAQMCMGGSANLARGLVDAVEESGGEILLGVEPRRIVVEDGRAIGVQLEDGTTLRATRLVASSLNPQQTFLDLMHEDDVPSAWRQRAEQFRYNLIGPLFALNLNLAEKPRYAITDDYPHIAQAFMTILGLDSYDRFPEIVSAHERGTIPPTVMWGATPTQFDPSQAPEGHHTSFMWEKLPYALGGDPSRWEEEKPVHGRRMLDLWSRHAPDLEDSVISWFTRSAVDTERSFPNMRTGDLLVGALDHGQIGSHRPFPDAGHYRGHVEGLYLCGSSSHPGGNITGLPGYNSAQVVHADLGLDGPFPGESLEQRLSG